jgi:hypothetical protein
VDLRFGERRIREGKYQFAFTVNQGGDLRFFAVSGTETVDMPDEGFEPGWTAPHMLLQLAYISKDEVHILWHLGDKAGRIPMRLGLGSN